MEHGCRLIYVGFPSSVGLGDEDSQSHVPMASTVAWAHAPVYS